VRNLEREIANLCRKVAKRVAEGKAKVFDVTGILFPDISVVPNTFPKRR